MTASVDASAILAIALNEPESDRYVALLNEFDVRIMNPVNYWEALVRMHKESGDTGVSKLEALMSRFGIVVVPATADQARLAAATFARYGKSHPAKLNLGDCFAYATARSYSAKLLFKGNDFPLTDILA